MAPNTVPATTPKAKPAATLDSVTAAWSSSSPVRARSAKVWKMTDGGGTRRPLDQPQRTAISQNTASATGSNNPSAGRRTRAVPAFDAACDSSACSTPAVMATRDTARPSNAISRIPRGCLGYGARARASVRRRHVAIVDEVVDRLLDVDTGADHARLLQRKAGFEDRFALRRADLVVGELGALLELLVDDGIGQLGNGDEGFLELPVVGERIFARLLVARNHPPHDIGVILGELLAHIEDAPGVGVAVAVEQPRTLVDFVLRHHRVEAGPGIDIAADQQVATVGVLLHQHRRDV